MPLTKQKKSGTDEVPPEGFVRSFPYDIDDLNPAYLSYHSVIRRSAGQPVAVANAERRLIHEFPVTGQEFSLRL